MARTRDQDACPGALQLHRAADGALARVRLPGGMIGPRQLEALAHAATRFGSPAMELTSRGNIQIRGVGDDGTAALADAVAAAGLLPSPTHERVRNIVASPLSGRLGGRADVREWVSRLDREICADPALAELPGRFWFSLDDGRGDVSGLAADVGAHALGDTVAVLLAGRDTGVRITPPDVVATLTSIARRFTGVRENAWRVAEYLAAVGAPIVVTPWRSVLVCDLDEGVADAALRVLAPMGLVFDDTSPWLHVSACTGRPGCEHSAADVRADATRAVDEHASVHRHFVGCERACGSPPDGEVLIATADGYVLRTPPP